MSDTGEIVGATFGAVFGALTAGAGATVGAMVASGAKGAALGASFMADKPERQSPRYDFEEPKNTASNIRSIPIVYGENKVTGNIIYNRVYGDNNQFKDMQVALSEGPIKSISNVKADEVDIDQEEQVKKDTHNIPENASFITTFTTVKKVKADTTRPIKLYFLPQNPSKHNPTISKNSDGYYEADTTINLSEFGFELDSFEIKLPTGSNPDPRYGSPVASIIEVADGPRGGLGTREQNADPINLDNESFPYTAYTTVELKANEDTPNAQFFKELIRMLDFFFDRIEIFKEEFRTS